MRKGITINVPGKPVVRRIAVSTEAQRFAEKRREVERLLEEKRLQKELEWWPTL